MGNISMSCVPIRFRLLLEFYCSVYISGDELGISLALNVGSLTTAHHLTILRGLPSLRHSSQVPQILAMELEKNRRSPKISVEQAMYSENRFKMLTRTKPEDAKRLAELAQADVNII